MENNFIPARPGQARPAFRSVEQGNCKPKQFLTGHGAYHIVKLKLRIAPLRAK